MAQKVRTIRLSWENDDSFKMDTNLDGGDWSVVVEMDENNHFISLWGDIDAVCKKFFEREMATIGAEMKA